MKAVIVTGGKQYTVSEGDVLFVEKLNAEADETVKFDQVLAVVDGETGLLILDPDEITFNALKAKYDDQQLRKALLQSMTGLEDVTLDGKHIKLYCNIGSP